MIKSGDCLCSVDSRLLNGEQIQKSEKFKTIKFTLSEQMFGKAENQWSQRKKSIESQNDLSGKYVEG
jgi:hypothetical protein